MSGFYKDNQGSYNLTLIQSCLDFLNVSAKFLLPQITIMNTANSVHSHTLCTVGIGRYTGVRNYVLSPSLLLTAVGS